MNDSNFSSDPYFCFQDLSTSHLMDAEQSNVFSYFNSISNGLPTQQQQSQQQQTQHSGHQLQFSPLAVGQQQSNQQSNYEQQNTLLCNLTSNNSNNKNHCNTNNTLNGLPFVQIHTTDVNPTRSSFGNVFRRSTTNQDEIKSEPIKSENAETSTKDNVNATPTPPAVQGGGKTPSRLSTPDSLICGQHTQGNLNNGPEASASKENDENPRSTNACGSLPKLFKCTQCAFITLTESVLQQHVDSSHSGNAMFHADVQRRISCPGCNNFFYAHNSLYVHLCEDHRMRLDEANQLLEAVIQRGSYADQLQPQHHDSTQPKETPQPKIFLKNVECLREPPPTSRPLEEQPLIQLSDNYFAMPDFDNGCSALLSDVGGGEDDDYLGISKGPAKDLPLAVNSSPQQQQNPPKQKISIKSVDVLREPALLRRDLEMQNLGILNGGQCSDREFCDTLNADSQFSYGNSIDLDDAHAVPKEVSSFEKPRRPKIYIKNVDILKEPLALPPNLNVGGGLDFNFLSQNAGNFLSSSDSSVVTTQSQVFNGTGGAHLCLSNLVDSALLYDGTPSSNFLQNISELDTFALTQNNSGNNFMLEITNYPPDLESLSLTTSTTPQPTVTEPTPSPPPLAPIQQPNHFEFQSHPTPLTSLATTTTTTTTTSQHQQPQQKQKIFIKNVDILKQPQFQEQRRTLHLRTVDELNLMNKTEVENLIAPNLDAPQSSSAHRNYLETDNHSSTNNSKNSDVICAYDSLNLKTNEVDDSQELHNWAGGYSLSTDLDSIITEHAQSITVCSEAEMSLQKHLYDLETPQTSIITVLDIEELTSGRDMARANGLLDADRMHLVTEDVSSTNKTLEILVQASNDHHHLEAITTTPLQQQNVDHDVNSGQNATLYSTDMPQELKHEHQINVSQSSERSTPMSEKSEIASNSCTTSPALIDVPPQRGVCTKETMSSDAVETFLCLSDKQQHQQSVAPTIAVPVVSVASVDISVVSLSTTAAATPSAVTVPLTTKPATTAPTSIASTATVAPSPPEKGRIYVAGNLMEISSEKPSAPDLPKAVSVTGGTSIRGRPFGSNRTVLTKLRKLYGTGATVDVGMKCSFQGCIFRFKKAETLDYHKRCHVGNSSSSSSQSMICPECQSTNFSNWNTLHTHLWRAHQIDMELYSCELCQFKTPIYSRLINTHSKIHSDERNYKCDQCEKAFKNSKQLKNHRRWHRNAATASTTTAATAVKPGDGSQQQAAEPPPPTMHRCKDCGSAFSHQKTLREHVCKENAAVQKSLRCEICERVVSSRSSLKLHMHIHETASRFKCTSCDYRASDHNAFRRHKMTHDKSKMYLCPYCDYKSIQSVAYQKHIQQKHPELADNIVLKCSVCSFSTINRSLLAVHVAKHSSAEKDSQTTAECDQQPSVETCTPTATAAESLSIETGSSSQQQQQQQQPQKNKIKVKSDLVLTDPAKFSKCANSSSVPPLLVHCFDDAIT